MIINNLKDLIALLPDLIYVFLPGYIFMCIYIKLHNKKIDISILFLWSLFISCIIKTFYSGLHSLIFTSHDFNEYIKILFYVVTGAILPFIIILIYRNKYFRALLKKSNKQTINSDILDDVIDYDVQTLMYVYLKNSNIYYAGTFILKEENGRDSRIALINYATLDKETNQIVYKPDYNSSTIINLNDIERLEIIYENNSQTWQQLTNKSFTTNKKENKKVNKKHKKETD